MADLNFAVNLNPSGEQNLGTSEKAWAKAYVSDLGTNPDGTQVVNVNYVSDALSEIETGAIPSVPQNTTGVGDFVLVNASTSGNSVDWSPMTLGNVFTSNTDGLAPHPGTGQNTASYILTGAGTWKKDSDFAVFGGATNTSNGTAGLVKRPTSGEQNKFLRGNGNWTDFVSCSEIDAQFDDFTANGTFSAKGLTYLYGSTYISYYADIRPGTGTYPHLSLSNNTIKIYTGAATTPTVITSEYISAPTVSAPTHMSTALIKNHNATTGARGEIHLTSKNMTFVTNAYDALASSLRISNFTSQSRPYVMIGFGVANPIYSTATNPSYGNFGFAIGGGTYTSANVTTYYRGMWDTYDGYPIFYKTGTGSAVHFAASAADYAEKRLTNNVLRAGSCVVESGDGDLQYSTKRLQKGCHIVSDTYGLIIGAENGQNKVKTALGVAGQVLAYPYESIEEFAKHIGDGVCSGPDGTVSIMTDEEVKENPLCVIGTIAYIPQEDKFGDTEINGRVWITLK